MPSVRFVRTPKRLDWGPYVAAKTQERKKPNSHQRYVLSIAKLVKKLRPETGVSPKIRRQIILFIQHLCDRIAERASRVALLEKKRAPQVLQLQAAVDLLKLVDSLDSPHMQAMRLLIIQSELLT